MSKLLFNSSLSKLGLKLVTWYAICAMSLDQVKMCIMWPTCLLCDLVWFRVNQYTCKCVFVLTTLSNAFSLQYPSFFWYFLALETNSRYKYGFYIELMLNYEVILIKITAEMDLSGLTCTICLEFNRIRLIVGIIHRSPASRAEGATY